jgi:hypothetical protein
VVAVLLTAGAQVNTGDMVSCGFDSCLLVFLREDTLPSIMLVLKVIWRW